MQQFISQNQIFSKKHFQAKRVILVIEITTNIENFAINTVLSLLHLKKANRKKTMSWDMAILNL